MDKGRHPQVVRTWTVERTKVVDHSRQAVKRGDTGSRVRPPGPSKRKR
jgi:hypothetical protein